MVFSGRPSSACHACRQGRLKCDRRRPTCGQCVRKNIACPGYRDTTELAIRDESKSAARKVHQKKGGSPSPYFVDEQSQPAQLPQASAQWEEQCSSSPFAATPLAVPSSPSQPIEPLALGYFINGYVPASSFEYLADVYQGTPAPAVLSATITAASFASLYLRLSDQDILKTARLHYADALTKTNAALSSPSEATLNSTLLAVLLLGLFEAVVYEGTRSPDSWTAHTMGSLSLLRLRGSSQFETPLGRHLFLQAATNIRTSCLQQLVAVPPEMSEMHDAARPFYDDDDPNIRMAPLIDHLASLRVLAHRASPSPLVARRVIEEALELDAKAVRHGSQLGDPWLFETRPAPPAITYLRVAHRYRTIRGARHWGALRLIRIYLNDLVWVSTWRLTDADASTLDVAALRAAAVANATELCDDVLASVLHFAGPDGRLSSLAARFVIWPLTTVMVSAISPPAARQWAIRCLREIGEEGRIPQALEAAALGDRLDDEDLPHDWMHLSHFS